MQNAARLLITASHNLHCLDDAVSPPVVQLEVPPLEVPPPKIVICHLIFLNIFHNIKTAVIFFLVKIWL
jgi:hypothetical protein